MDITRRKLLKAKAALATAAATGISINESDQAFAQTNEEPLKPISLNGIHGYAQKSITAGEPLELRVSSNVPYGLSVYRLQHLDAPGPKDEQIYPLLQPGPPVQVSPTVEEQVIAPIQQDIRPGSYIHVENNLPNVSMDAITLECWVRPWDTSRWQGLISQYTWQGYCGVGLFLRPGGNLVFYVGGGGQYSPNYSLTAATSLNEKQWYHIVGTWNKSTGLQQLFLNGAEVANKPNTVDLFPGNAPLRIAAYGVTDNGVNYTADTFHGDMAMPVIYSRTLSQNEIQARANQTAPTIPSTGVLAVWPFNEEQGETVTDASGQLRSGKIVNRATWMIGGPGFDAANDAPRYGDYDLKTAFDNQYGHGIRFAIDDLYDCGWQVNHSVPIPINAKNGIYAARLSSLSGGSIYHITFVIKRPQNQPKAPVLILASTNTWLAYNRGPFTNASSDPRLPRFSMYDDHHGGFAAYQVGLNMPWPHSSPYAVYYPGGNYSHLTRAEHYMHQWLEGRGYEFDVATDFDMDSDPNLLNDYEVVMILGHSEYWSVVARQRLDAYLSTGGNALVMSGNTMMWRVSLDITQGILECRKYGFGSSVDLSPGAQHHGEVWHSTDHKRGSMLRDSELPCWSVLGLESAGHSKYFVGDLSRSFTPYTVTNPNHQLFTTPNDSGLGLSDVFGQAEGGGLPRAVGHEFDARVSELQNHGSINDPISSQFVLAESKISDGFRAFPYFDPDNPPPNSSAEDVASQIIYWPRPQGGKVFYAGSIACGWTLPSDSKFSVIIDNVLENFGVKPQTTNGQKLLVSAELNDNEIHTMSLDLVTNRVKAKKKSSPTWLPGLLVSDDLGGESDFPPSLVSHSGAMYAYIVRPDGTLGTKWSFGSHWIPGGDAWYNLGGNLSGAPFALSAGNILDIFAPGIQGDIQIKWWNGSNWSGWVSLGGQAHNLGGPVAALKWGGNLISIATTGSDGNIYYKWSNGSQWVPSLNGNWINLGGGILKGSVAMVSVSGSELHIFAHGTDNYYYHKWWNASGWKPWTSLGTQDFQDSPFATVNNTGQINVFGIGQDGHVYNKWTLNGQWISNWVDMGDQFEGKVTAISRSGNRFDMFAIGTDKIVKTKYFDGSEWIPSLTEWTNLST